MESVNNSGTFADISCPRLLVRLHLERFTGTLRISRGAVLKFLYFQTGEIAMASSNDQDDHLAPILMRSGKLKVEQMDLARKQAQPGTSLARVLVQMGFLTSGELFSGARQQLRQIVGSVLSLTEGHYEIQNQYFPREITSLNVDTRELLLGLVQDLPGRSFVLLEVGAPDTVYFPTGSPSSEAALPALPKRWQDCAGRFTGPMTVHAFGQAAGLDDFAASKTVYGLHLFGLLERKAEEPEMPEIPQEIPVEPPIEVEEAIPLTDEAAEIVQEPVEPPPAEQPPEPEEAKEPGGAEIPITPVAPEVSAPASGPPEDVPSPGQAADAGRPLSPRLSPESNGEGEDFVSRGEPIRLEFLGPQKPSSPPPRFAGPWGIFSIFAGIAILVAAFAWFVFLKESPAPESSSPPLETAATAPESPAVETPEEEETGPVPTEEPFGAGSSDQTAPPAPAHAPSGQTGATVAAAIEGPGEKEPSPAQPAESQPMAGAEGAGTEGIAPATAAGAISGIPPFSAAGRFQEARALFEAGDFAAAAGSWLETTQQETKKSFTLQIAIACQERSLSKAARRTRGSADFFVVPFSLDGRPCYRLCWGAYASQEEAVSGKASVPEFFLDEGGRPLVVSLGKLAPMERR